MLIELDPVERITAGAVGPPGQRVFYLQGRKGGQLVTLMVEKQQVQLLDEEEAGEEVEDEQDEEGADSGGLGPDIAIEGLGDLEGNGEVDEEAEDSHEDEELDALEVEDDSIEELEELEALAAREPARVRFWATREQMLSLARHGATISAAGRPRCQLCGNPIDPEGHQCPALNGHRKMDAG